MKEEDQYSINNNNNNFHHTYHHQEQQQLLLQQQIMIQQQQQQQQQQSMMFPNSSISSEQVVISSSSPWSNNNIPQYPAFNNHHHHFLQPPSNSSSLPYASFFNNNTRLVGVPSMHHHQFASPSSYEGPSSNDHLRIISETLHQHHQGVVGPFGLQAEIGKMTAQEIMEAKALAASKSHSEAERRRRERINNHLAKLRTLLPSTTKTDKASLLAEVIQHVKELKRQTSVIAETSPVPTESDELTVDDASDEDGKFVIKASLCCEDRSDLLPELIKTLKSLRLRTLKADITTLGGRVKNVLFITADHDNHNEDYYSSSNNNSSDDDNINNNNDHYQQQQQYCISSIQEALRAVMEKSVGNSNDSASSSVKRQRTNMISIS